MPCTAIRTLSISWFGTSRALRTWRMGTPARRAKSAYVWRPAGRVLVDIPLDVALNKIHWDPESYPKSVEIASYRPTTRGHDMQIRKAAQFIAESSRPVLYVGGGAIAADAHDEVTELAERTNIL